LCRLFGNITQNSSKLDFAEFEELTLMSKFGGPDSTDYYEDDLAQFGFNRLSILDTSAAGNQPIVSPSNRYVVLMNGEIYNFKDLILQFHLQNLRSGSDVEVVAHLIEILPFSDVITLLDGMFALVVWDKLEKRCFMARDFAGIKPLFYAYSSKGLVFASQFNQITKHSWLSQKSIFEVGLREYIQLGYMQAPHTIFEGIKQLEPGKYITYSWEQEEFEVKQYQMFFQETKKQIYHETAKDTLDLLRSTLADSVKKQLIADVPLGVFLSGGIDSTLVAANAVKFNPEIESLTIGFEDKEFDESAQAKEYAKILGIKNETVVLNDNELLSIYNEHFENLTEPFADYSSLPTFLISKISSQKFKVMLSGDGGDELFWGYPRFNTFANSIPFFQIPGKTNRKIATRILKKANYDVTGFLSEGSLGKANFEFQSYNGSNAINSLFNQSPIISDELKLGYEFDTRSKVEGLNYLRRNEFYNHLQKVLIKVDRMSMANGLEVRVPLLGKEMLKLADQIQPELHNHKELKFLLKKLVSESIPQNKMNLKKTGFTPPLLRWSKSILKDEIIDTIMSKSSFSESLLNKNEVKKLVDSYYTGNSGSIESLWTLYALEKSKSQFE
jgi:asparagine synthase (glutamine-hydrolysing)